MSMSEDSRVNHRDLLYELLREIGVYRGGNYKNAQSYIG
jgi:hypothetical protein